MTRLFIQKLYLIICLIFFNIICSAHTFEIVMSVSLHKVLEKEYLFENKKKLNKYLSENSLESLITSAEKSYRQSQELLFFLYCYHIITDSRVFAIDNNNLITLSDDNLLRIKNLIKKASSTESWLALSFYQLEKNNYEKAMSYLNKAKEKGNALAYLFSLILTTVNHQNFQANKITGSPTTNIESIYQILKEMKDRNITIFGFNMLMGVVLFVKNKNSEALEYFRKEIKEKRSQKFLTASIAYVGLIHDRNNQRKLAKKNFIKAVERGNDMVKSRLLDIYLKEGNYTSSWNLLQEIATQWGKYNDTPSIKTSFLISYMLSQGLGRKKDIIQSYVWATRAKAIYNISKDPNIWKIRTGDTNRYALYSNIEFNPHIVKTTPDIVSPNRKQKRYTPQEMFDLMKIHDINKINITTEQVQIIEAQITSLTEKLKASKQLQLAIVNSNNTFEELHPFVSECARSFH